MSNIVKGILAPLALSQEKDQSGGGAGKYIMYIFHTIMFVAAVYLSWYCNLTSSTVARVLWAMLAGVFNMFYLIYYLVYRVIMGAKC